MLPLPAMLYSGRTGIHQPYANGRASEVINLSKCAFRRLQVWQTAGKYQAHIPGVAAVVAVVFIDEFVVDGTKER